MEITGIFTSHYSCHRQRGFVFLARLEKGPWCRKGWASALDGPHMEDLEGLVWVSASHRTLVPTEPPCRSAGHIVVPHLWSAASPRLKYPFDHLLKCVYLPSKMCVELLVEHTRRPSTEKACCAETRSPLQFCLALDRALGKPLASPGHSALSAQRLPPCGSSG